LFELTAGIYNPGTALWGGWRVIQVVVVMATYGLLLSTDDEDE
jgi:hypothetical protein